MAAVLCGRKRSFFHDLPSTPSPIVSKRLCCSSSASQVPYSVPALLDQLRIAFPHIDPHVVKKALRECDDDLEFAIKSLHEICLTPTKKNPVSTNQNSSNNEKVNFSDNPNKVPKNNVEWVDLFVKELMGATSVDDAKVRAARVLESFHKSIRERVDTEAESLKKENMVLKDQVEGAIRDNNILKRAVAILHERQKEYEDGIKELKTLKELVAQNKEDMRKLVLNNYGLTMQLRQATQQSNPIMGRFNPDVF